jgi:hypothetical protein
MRSPQKLVGTFRLQSAWIAAVLLIVTFAFGLAPSGVTFCG